MAINKKLIPCNLFGGTKFKLLYEDELGDNLPPVDYDFGPENRKTFAIVKCKECGLIFTNPMPNMRDAYQDVVDPIFMDSEKQRRETARRVLKEIRQYVHDGGRLLDVGCNTGLFLDEAEKFYKVEGVELSKWASAIAAKHHLVHTQPISELDLIEKFDVVTLFGVIEHFENPMLELQSIAKVLKPNGLFVVYTGDVEAWLPRILGKSWWWFQGMHLFYFSLKTLSKMLNNVGFDIVANRNYVVYFQLYSLANSINRYAIGRLFRPIFNLTALRDRMVGLRLSGEMLVFSRKKY